jgi:ADP-heptose:LPS heptosyltransferase
VKILAIRFARLGDVVLLLPALSSLKEAFPGSHLTFLTGHRCASIAEMCPAIDEVIAVNRIEMRDGPIFNAVREMAHLVRDIRKRRFDIVVDFHSFRETNLLAWLSGAPVRMAMQRHQAPYLGFCFNRPAVREDKSIHVSEMFRMVVAALPSSAAPFAPHQARARPIAVDFMKTTVPTLALYVDAPVPERVWPPERFAEVADFAIERLNAAVIVISSKAGTELAARVRQASRNPGRLSLLTDIGVPQLVSVIASSQMLISNDTGPMHIGPAVGVQTLGLFSVGYPEHFRPIGPHDEFLRANPIAGIEVKEVIEILEKMWITAGRDLRH